MSGTTTRAGHERRRPVFPIPVPSKNGARPDRPLSAVVIGAGFGGLAAAIRLQAAGVRVSLLEKRARIGGRAYRLEERGYTFDTGPSLITAPALLDDVFRAGGRRLSDHVELIPLDPYYRVHFHDGTSIDYVGDRERMKAQMRRFDPRDAERFDAFMDDVRPIYDAVIGDRLGTVPFDTPGSMLSLLPRILRLGAHRSVTSFVNRHFDDFRHRFLFSFHPLFVGGNPFSTPAIYLMIPYLERRGGVWFAPGGMYSVVEAMGSLFRELGGTIHVEHEVERIVVEDGRARGVVARGRRFDADLVVSNADPGHTYGALVSPESRKRWTDRKVENLDYSMSCFLLYLGVKRQYPELVHHTLILTERYEGLVKDIFRRKILPEDFSMYLHVPTRTDPSMAPPGCESMYVLVPVANNRSGVDWSRAGMPFARRILSFLEEWGLDGLRENLDVLRVFTPDDFASELNAPHGNAFSVEPRLTQTAWFRPQNRSEDVDGLYLVGAGTHPGAGVPGVILSAATTYRVIAEDLGLPSQWCDDTPGRVELDELHAGV
ncbi:MAG TPA: phytoene desaturase family protein [Longimicrobiales bacterium]|nr:phytoene desaturase family protein [Longimicrobiales bacterium]